MSILEQIKSNSITDLDLSVDADEVSEKHMEIVDALKGNTSIVSIRFEQEFLAHMKNDTRREVIEAIGHIPTLKKVQLSDALVLASAVTKMVIKAKALRELNISSLVLQGLESDFSALEAALAAHGSLKVFKMDECKPAVKDISLDGLVTSMKLTNISDPVPNKAGATTA